MEINFKNYNDVVNKLEFFYQNLKKSIIKVKKAFKSRLEIKNVKNDK